MKKEKNLTKELIKKNRIRSKDETVVRVIGYVVLTMLALFALLPMLMLFSSSISSEESLMQYGYGFFPREFSLDSYKYMWAMRESIGTAYLVSIGVTVFGTALSILITSMLAYGLIQKGVPGVKVIMVILVITMLFSGGQVASYITWSSWFHIGNSIFALIFPNLLMSAFTVMLVVSYYRSSISPELMEAARIDGAGEFTIYFKLVMPLSTPILATIGLMEAIMYWNDWTNGLYYIDEMHSQLYSIQLLLNKMNESIDFLANNPNVAGQLGELALPSTAVRMAIAFIGILPILIAYPFFQKYFAAGLTLGGVKG